VNVPLQALIVPVVDLPEVVVVVIGGMFPPVVKFVMFLHIVKFGLTR